MIIQTVVFQRTEDGKKERGLLIDEGFGPIIDKRGNIVPEVWTYDRTYNLVIDLEWLEGEE